MKSKSRFLTFALVVILTVALALSLTACDRGVSDYVGTYTTYGGGTIVIDKNNITILDSKPSKYSFEKDSFTTLSAKQKIHIFEDRQIACREEDKLGKISGSPLSNRSGINTAHLTLIVPGYTNNWSVSLYDNGDFALFEARAHVGSGTYTLKKGVLVIKNFVAQDPERSFAEQWWYFDTDGNLYTQAFIRDPSMFVPEEAGNIYPDITGTGSQEDPYLIRSAEAFTKFRDRVNDGEDFDHKFVDLGADIDLAAIDWQPIGEKSFYHDPVTFKGMFNGKGYVVRNVRISALTKCAGLFASNGGTIINLGLENVKIVVDSPLAGALAGENNGFIANCFATGKIQFTGTQNSSVAGGLVGNNNGTVANCYATTNVIVSAKSVEAGGLIGNNGGSIRNSFASGNVSASSSTNNALAGGLIGKMGIYNTLPIDNSYRCAEQTITRNGYVSPTNLHGETASVQNLVSEQWITENLWTFETGVWSFRTNEYPALNCEYLMTNPIVELSTAEQIAALSGQILTLKYRLTSDIDLDGAELMPIEDCANVFDGNECSISNYTVSEDVSFAGLFRFNWGVIEDLNIVGFSNFGLVGKNMGEINKCSSANNSDVSSTENYQMSGLVGYNLGIVSDSYSTADSIKGGLACMNAGAIVRCYAAGDVMGTGYYVGGLVGENTGSIAECYAIGNVSGDFSVGGGLVGYMEAGSIRNCYAIGNVNTNSNYNIVDGVSLGGLVGKMSYGEILYSFAKGNVSATGVPTSEYFPVCAGGLIGQNYYGLIGDCFAAGDVTATSTDMSGDALAGGLIGKNHTGIIGNCYHYQGQTISSNTDDVNAPTDVELCTLDQLNDKPFYVEMLGWSDDIWAFVNLAFDEGIYPYFCWEYSDAN